MVSKTFFTFTPTTLENGIHFDEHLFNWVGKKPPTSKRHRFLIKDDLLSIGMSPGLGLFFLRVVAPLCLSSASFSFGKREGVVGDKS